MYLVFSKILDIDIFPLSKNLQSYRTCRWYVALNTMPIDIMCNIRINLKICINNKKWTEEETVKEKVFKSSLFTLVMPMSEKAWNERITFFQKIYNVTFRKHLACVYLVCLSLSKLERKNLSQQPESLTCVSVYFKIFTKNTGVLSSNAHNN